MPRKKAYVETAVPASIPTVSGQTPASGTPGKLVFSDILGPPSRPNMPRSVDLSGRLGRGVDPWVAAALQTLTRLLASGVCSPKTACAKGDAMKLFLDFLTLGRPEPLVAEPALLKPLHVTQFADWMQRRGEARALRKDSVRVQFHQCKTVLAEMMAQGVIPADPTKFFPPRSHLPNGNSEDRGERALSDAEFERLAVAVKQDLSDVHHGRLTLYASDAMANRFLVVAMRTGGNTRPLLDLGRDALLPGLLPGTMRLRLVKQRGHLIQDRALVRGSTVDHPTLTPMDAVAVLERTLADTHALVAEAVPPYDDKVWLYRTLNAREYGAVRCLSESSLSKAIVRMVARRQLVGDDGSPLRVNVSRLRKTFAKRVFRLRGNDVLSTASVLGNTPQVADLNYLHVDDQLKAEGALYVGRELTVHLRGKAPAQIVPIEPDRSSATPLARCQDTLYGDRAPKDGSNHCDLFVLCLFCPSFAIVGELDDLWRLFSFQAFAQSELDRLERIAAESGPDAAGSRLTDLYRQAIPFITTFTRQAFGASLVSRAQKKAQTHLHPFWYLQLKRVAARGN